MKKVLLLSFVFVFLLNTVGFAAVSGSKPRTSSPPKSTSTQTTTPSNSYKPSAPANTLNAKAPAPPQVSGQSKTGGFLRNIALLGGGMLLGGMLGSMFGFGAGGMLSTIFGLLVNLILLVAIFKLGAYLWTRYKTRRGNKVIQ